MTPRGEWRFVANNCWNVYNDRRCDLWVVMYAPRMSGSEKIRIRRNDRDRKNDKICQKSRPTGDFLLIVCFCICVCTIIAFLFFTYTLLLQFYNIRATRQLSCALHSFTKTAAGDAFLKTKRLEQDKPH